jgi:hypothetical protein
MCCGKKRNSYQSGLSQGSRQATPGAAFSAGPGKALFEYTGNSTLSVSGPITGQRYYFSRHGAQVEVDVRDRAWLARVPVLRAIY